ncbi:formimidoylglutamase [Gangjinia marincola]|uniref:Formimidoylglutamase n=1 Tax=Gangjinia marincola TaxID=578463 RepID=A0ABN1MGR1_9FLAO
MLKSITTDQSYAPTSSSIWQGRNSPPEETEQYWHEIIQLEDLNDLEKNSKTPQIGIMSYACDEGVKRNHGRVGSADGPQAILKQLAKLPVHIKNKTITDYGTIQCLNGDLESTQNALAVATAQRLKQGIFPINVGGGHDIAYATYCGVRDALANSTKKSLGILNFDAHFDLRLPVNEPNSGTPFYQILNDQSTSLNREYVVLGIQRQSNTRSLFATAQQHDVVYISNEYCTTDTQHLNAVHTLLDRFIHRNDYIYLSIDIDAFSSAYAPGVSAPSPQGFDPMFFFKVLDYMLKSPKVIAIDLAETNPRFDQDNATSRLAARIIDTIATKLSFKKS